MVKISATHNSTRACFPFPMKSSKLSGLSSTTLDALTLVMSAVRKREEKEKNMVGGRNEKLYG